MRIVDLDVYGWPGYKLREDGWLVNQHGREIGGNANGQVRMQLGYGDGSSWLSLAWIVAKVFVENPSNYMYVRHKDGNKSNLHYTNLEWWPSKAKFGSKAINILRMLNGDLSVETIAKEVRTSTSYVRAVAAERLKTLQDMAENGKI